MKKKNIFLKQATSTFKLFFLHFKFYFLFLNVVTQPKENASAIYAEGCLTARFHCVEDTF